MHINQKLEEQRFLFFLKKQRILDAPDRQGQLVPGQAGFPHKGTPAEPLAIDPRGQMRGLLI